MGDEASVRRKGRPASPVRWTSGVVLALLLLVACEAAPGAADVSPAADVAGHVPADGLGAADASPAADVAGDAPEDALLAADAPRAPDAARDVEGRADSAGDAPAADVVTEPPPASWDPTTEPWPGCGSAADRRALAAAGDGALVAAYVCALYVDPPSCADGNGCFQDCLAYSNTLAFQAPPVVLSDACSLCWFADAKCVRRRCPQCDSLNWGRLPDGCRACAAECQPLYCACAGRGAPGCDEETPNATAARCGDVVFVDTGADGTAERDDYACEDGTAATLPGPEVDVPVSLPNGQALCASLLDELGGAQVLVRASDGTCVGAAGAPPVVAEDGAPVVTVDGPGPAAAVLSIDCATVEAETCDGGRDEDFDGLTDCADPDCADSLPCCVADCRGRACADGGCDDCCVPPGADWQCVDGTCACAAWACDGRACGDDGCGASCGICPDGQACTIDGRCVDILPVRALRCGDEERWSTALEPSLFDAYSCADTRHLVGPEAVYTYRSGAAGTVTVQVEHPYEEYDAPVATLLILEDLDATRCVAAVPIGFWGDSVAFEVKPDTWYAFVVDSSLESALFDIEVTCRGCAPPCGAGCGGGQRCDAGVCRPCAPRCEGRTCGPDGCGGSCGDGCAASQVCVAGRCAHRYPFACFELEAPGLEQYPHTKRRIDGEGRLVWESHGSAQEGDWDVHTWHFDDLGRLVRELSWPGWRDHASIPVNDLYLDTFDDRGQIVETRLDQGRDGTIDVITSYAWDDAGRKAAEGRDVDADGSPDRSEEWGYDDAGHLLRDALDHDGDGAFDRVEEWTYDDAGELVHHALDDDGDGAFDRVEEWTHDASGRLVRQTDDTDGDGSPDRIEEWTHDDGGRLVRRTLDADGDGSLDRIEEWAYDDGGRLVRHTLDTDGDDQLEDVTTSTYGADGRLTETVHEQFVGGALARREEETFDGADRPLETTIDGGGDYGAPDGVADEQIVWTYDADGHLLRQETDGGGSWGRADGSVDVLRVHEYDGAGQPTLETLDGGPEYGAADGAVDERTVWTYSGGHTDRVVTETWHQGQRDQRRTEIHRATGGLERRIEECGPPSCASCYAPAGVDSHRTETTFDAAGHRIAVNVCDCCTTSDYYEWSETETIYDEWGNRLSVSYYSGETDPGGTGFSYNCWPAASAGDASPIP